MRLANVTEFRTFFNAVLAALCDLFDRSPPMENEVIAPLTYMMLDDAEKAGREVTEFYLDIGPEDNKVWVEFMAGSSGSGDYIPFEGEFNHAKFDQFLRTIVDLTIDPDHTLNETQLQALKDKRFLEFYVNPDTVDSIIVDVFDVLEVEEVLSNTIH